MAAPANRSDPAAAAARVLSQGSWTPALNIARLLAGLRQLLLEPNPDDPLMADIVSSARHTGLQGGQDGRKAKGTACCALACTTRTLLFCTWMCAVSQLHVRVLSWRPGEARFVAVLVVASRCVGDDNCSSMPVLHPPSDGAASASCV